MTELSGGAQCIKYTLIVVNFVFWLGGLALLGVGIWIVADNNALQILRFAIGLMTAADLVWGAAIIVIDIAILVIIVGGFGLCGAIRKNETCLNCYSVVIILMLVAQVIALILAGVFYSQIMKDMSKNMNNFIQTQYGLPDSQFPRSTMVWDGVQRQASCCGVKNPMDWQTSWWIQNNNNTQNVPDSCCVPANTKSFSNLLQPAYPQQCQDAAFDVTYPNRETYIRVQGCEDKADKWLKNYFGFAMGCIGVVLVFQTIIVILSCILKSAVKNMKYQPI